MIVDKNYPGLISETNGVYMLKGRLMGEDLIIVLDGMLIVAGSISAWNTIVAFGNICADGVIYAGHDIIAKGDIRAGKYILANNVIYCGEKIFAGMKARAGCPFDKTISCEELKHGVITHGQLICGPIGGQDGWEGKMRELDACYAYLAACGTDKPSEAGAIIQAQRYAIEELARLMGMDHEPWQNRAAGRGEDTGPQIPRWMYEDKARYE